MDQKQERWRKRGEKFAREVWEACGRTLKACPADPAIGTMTPEQWRDYRAGYRGTLHILNLQAEIARKPQLALIVPALESLDALTRSLAHHLDVGGQP